MAKIQFNIPSDFDYKLNLKLADLKNIGVRKSKAELILNLAMIGLQAEKQEIEVK